MQNSFLKIINLFYTAILNIILLIIIALYPNSATTASSKIKSNTPHVTISKTRDLNPAGELITITGKGFSNNFPGIYVGIVAVNQFSPLNGDVYGDDTKYIRENEIKNGEFSTKILVKAKFKKTNCLVTQCEIVTLTARGFPDRSQDTKTLVYFANHHKANLNTKIYPIAKIVSIISNSKSYLPTNPKLKIKLSKSKNLNPTKNKILVSGSGFSGAGAGIYVGIAEIDKFSSTNASVYDSAKFIKANQIINGKWQTELTARAIFGEHNKFNCLKHQCAIFTLAAHGSTDRSQDSITKIYFSNTPQTGEIKMNLTKWIITILGTSIPLGLIVLIAYQSRNKSHRIERR